MAYNFWCTRNERRKQIGQRLRDKCRAYEKGASGVLPMLLHTRHEKWALRGELRLRRFSILDPRPFCALYRCTPAAMPSSDTNQDPITQRCWLRGCNTKEILRISALKDPREFASMDIEYPPRKYYFLCTEQCQFFFVEGNSVRFFLSSTAYMLK